MNISNKGTELIKFFESYKNKPYLDAIQIVTGGWGHLILDPTTNKRLKGLEGLKIALEMYPIITTELAETWLKQDLTEAESEVNKLIKVKLTQFQFDALVSFVFNCGVSETLFKYVNTMPLDSNLIGAWWMSHYITADGTKLKGLVKRRRVEYELFFTGELNLK